MRVFFLREGNVLARMIETAAFFSGGFGELAA